MTRAEAQERLRALDLPAGDYAVHGSAAMLLRGLIDDAGDLDILARGAAWRRACGLAPARAGVRDPVVRPLPDVEIWGGWLGADADVLIDGAERVAGWPCVRLREVLAFKRRLHRPKDRAHVRVLLQALGDADTP